MEMSGFNKLQSLLENGLSADSRRIAIRFEDQEISFGQLDLKMRRLAAGLENLGVKQGDRVAWFMPNCLEAVFTTLACYRIGAISVPLNHRYLPEEACHVMQAIQPSLFIYHTDRTEVVSSLMGMIDPLPVFAVGKDAAADSSHLSFDQLLNSEPQPEPASVGPNDPALILYTSGSTGQPKGSVHSHAGAYHGIDISRQIFDLNDQSRVLVGKPISHAGGLETQLMPTLLAGGVVTLTMNPAPAQAVKLIQEQSITEYAMLASDLLDFVEYLEQHPTKLSSLKTSIGSGDSVPADLHQRFRDLFGWEVLEACGMTELGGYYAANPLHGKRKWGSLGLPAPETRLRLVDDSGSDVAIETTGEIWVQSPSAAIGYWQNQRATNELFQEGWLRTGDLAYLDPDGYVWFVGRKKLMIVRRGSNIAPAEIESVLDSHLKVHASVVVGVPDRLDGHVPVACVAPMDAADPPTDDELREFISEHIAAYKNPKYYLFMPELPRNSAGKFHRQQLEQMAVQSVQNMQ